MKITEIRLNKRNGDDNLLAIGSITLEEDFVVNGIKVLRANDGNMFVGYPSRPNNKGGYSDVCFPLSKTLREDIHTQVIAKYESL
ncbi:MAG: SpoVG family protein [Lachnospira sp.]|nr:SpoVG family protein [Lachnospira sp.]